MLNWKLIVSAAVVLCLFATIGFFIIKLLKKVSVLDDRFSAFESSCCDEDYGLHQIVAQQQSASPVRAPQEVAPVRVESIFELEELTLEEVEEVIAAEEVAPVIAAEEAAPAPVIAAEEEVSASQSSAIAL